MLQPGLGESFLVLKTTSRELVIVSQAGASRPKEAGGQQMASRLCSPATAATRTA